MGADQSTKYPFSNCRIVVLGPKSGDAALAELAHLPKEARILATGRNLEELQKEESFFTEGNVLLNVTGNSKILGEVINEMPFLVWVHSITAGVDHLLCPQLVNNEDIVLTNAKGVFSSSLGEYVMGACSFFAKDFPRLMKQKNAKLWNPFCVTEIRGQTMGIVGYGSIGIACARLAKAYGMHVVALRRNPARDGYGSAYVDDVVGPDRLVDVMKQSDYLVVCMPLTPETRGMIRKEHLMKSKKGMILINIGRGPLIVEDDLIDALQDGSVAGAALDVFTTEPLPATSPIWTLPNVLLSPHNADLLVNSRNQSVLLFNRNCEKFLAGEDLDCIVDKSSGY